MPQQDEFYQTKVVFNAQSLAVIPFAALMKLECRLFLCGHALQCMRQWPISPILI